jgi:hypothetical protein
VLHADTAPPSSGRVPSDSARLARAVSPTGGGHIASLWAKARKVTHVAFRPDWNRFKKAAPFRRNDQMLDTLPKAVIACPGNGINANLVDKARKMGITVWKVEKEK